MGLLLSLMSACVLLSVKAPVMPLALVGLVVVPLFLVARMRRVGAVYSPYNRFMPLWLFGMYTVIFGTLICTLLSSCYVVLFEPDFINVYIDRTMAELSEGLQGEMRQMHAQNMEMVLAARERHLLPSPLEFVSSLGWSTAFFGSLLTMPLAALAVRRAPRAALK